jgi:uncharacterized protein YraI
MSLKSNLLKAAGLGVVVTALTAGAALAAVATSSVNVRTGPGTGYRIVDTLRPGERVAINGQSAGWCRVSKSGPDGWVSCAYLADSGVNVRPFYRSYHREPSVSFSFGFGTPYPYPRHHHHMQPRPVYPGWWW